MMNKDLQKTTWQNAMYLLFPSSPLAFLMLAWLLVSTNRPTYFPDRLPPGKGREATKPLGRIPLWVLLSPGQPAPRGDRSGPVLFLGIIFGVMMDGIRYFNATLV